MKWQGKMGCGGITFTLCGLCTQHLPIALLALQLAMSLQCLTYSRMPVCMAATTNNRLKCCTGCADSLA